MKKSIAQTPCTLQALTETAYGEGLVVRGRHRALLCEDTEAACEEESRREAERMLLSPVMMLATHCSRDNNRWGSSLVCNLLLWLIVKLREREGQRVDLGRSLKGHL